MQNEQIEQMDDVARKYRELRDAVAEWGKAYGEFQSFYHAHDGEKYCDCGDVLMACAAQDSILFQLSKTL